MRCAWKAVGQWGLNPDRRKSRYVGSDSVWAIGSKSVELAGGGELVFLRPSCASTGAHRAIASFHASCVGELSGEFDVGHLVTPQTQERVEGRDALRRQNASAEPS